jgi:hypothetical protein
MHLEQGPIDRACLLADGDAGREVWSCAAMETAA